MRTFRITGLFGMQFTLSTYAPGNVSIKYPIRTRTEPVISQEASTSTNNRLYNSELTFNIPAEASGTPFPRATPSTTARRPASSPPSRTPSLAATEIVPFELTQAEIVTDIQTQGIKVRDFAYEPQSIPPLPEFWDAPKALGEYDFRLAEEPRRVAINGKTLRRLLDVGWVTVEDAKRRWHRIDWAALAKHDSRPAYPWRWRRDKKPSGEKRLAMLKERTGFLRAYDHAHRELELQRQRELARGPVRIVVADADAEMEGKGKGKARAVNAVRRYRQNQAQPDKKREMEEETTPRHVRTSTTHDSKRRRLSASPSPEARSMPSA